MTTRHFAYIVWPVIAVVVLLVALAFVGGADWGNLRRGPTVDQACLMEAIQQDARTRPCISTENRVPDSALLAAMFVVKLLLVSIMLRRMARRDWLTISLSVMLLTFAAVWVYVLAARLWPDFFADHRMESQWIVRVSVMFAASWAAVQLLRTPDPAIEARRLAHLNRIQGRQEGIALEKHAQSKREENA